MGSAASFSKDKGDLLKGIKRRKHDPVFYRGVLAAQEGRYTEAELCFQPMIVKHPFFAAYAKLVMDVERTLQEFSGLVTAPGEKATAFHNPKPPSESLAKQKSTRFTDGGPLSADMGNETEAPAFTDVVAIDDINDTPRSAEPAMAADGMSRTGTQQSSLTNRAEFAFPAGKELESMLNLSQLMRDVEEVYISCDTERARQLAILYACCNTVLQQVNCVFVGKLRDERAKGRKSGVRLPGTFLPEAGSFDPKIADESDVECALELFEETCRQFLITSSVNYGTLALTYAEGLIVDNDEAILTLGDKASAKAALREKAMLKRRQARVYEAVDDLCQQVIDLTWYYAERHPDDYLSRVLFKTLPPRRATEDVFGDEVQGEDSSDEGDIGDGDNGIGIPTDSAGMSSRGTTMSKGVVHGISRFTAALKSMLDGKGGGTLIVPSRTFTPDASITLPIRQITQGNRLVLSSVGTLTKVSLAKLESPGLRIASHNLQWTLPEEADLADSYPGTNYATLCIAIPEHFSIAEDGSLIYNKAPILTRLPTSNAYIDAIIERVKAVRPAEDAARMAAITAAGSMKTIDLPNPNLDLSNEQVRRCVCMEEYIMCLKLLLILAAKVKKLRGHLEDSRSCAAAVVLITACVRGVEADRRVKFQMLLTDLGLL